MFVLRREHLACSLLSTNIPQVQDRRGTELTHTKFGTTSPQFSRKSDPYVFEENRQSRTGSNYGRSFCIQCSVDLKDLPPSCCFSRLKELGPIHTGVEMPNGTGNFRNFQISRKKDNHEWWTEIFETNFQTLSVPFDFELEFPEILVKQNPSLSSIRCKFIGNNVKMVSKLRSRTSKTMQLVPVHLDLPLFRRSHCATCSRAYVILYHVTGSCKEPVIIGVA